MRILVINLERHVDRREWMESQLAERAIAFEHMPACDASDLSEEHVAEINRSCETGLTHDAAEISCNRSHKKCWKAIADGDDDYACILEDDVHLSRDAAKFLTSADWIPKDVDVIKLETWNREVECSREAGIPVFDRKLRELTAKHPGSAGYILSRKAAARLLQNTTNNYASVSFLLFGSKSTRSAHLKTLQLVPALCIQDMRKSGTKNPKLTSTTNHNLLVNDAQSRAALEEKIRAEKLRTGRKPSNRIRDLRLRIKEMLGLSKPIAMEIVPFKE